MNKYDYTGKKVYVGIDVHKKTYICVSMCEGQIVKRDAMPAKPNILLHYLQKSFNGAKINTAYEAGFSGFHLHRFLISQEIDNKVIHPGSIEVASRDRVKTDKRDARKISEQLAAGRLRSVFVPTQKKEEMRCLTRLRENLLRLRHQVGMQFKSLLFTQGLIECDDETRLSRSWLLEKIKEVRQKGYSEDFCFVLEEYAHQWMEITKRLIAAGKNVKKQSEQEKSLQIIYESVPGIGPIHGRELANELGDMKQFKNEKALFSFTGLTPSEYSSGEHTRQGHITRQGNSRLRRLLIEASWVAIGRDPNLKEIFNRIAAKRGKKRAIVAIARRLIGRIRSCVLTGMLYEIKSTEEVCSNKTNSMTSLKDLCVLK